MSSKKRTKPSGTTPATDNSSQNSTQPDQSNQSANTAHTTPSAQAAQSKQPTSQNRRQHQPRQSGFESHSGSQKRKLSRQFSWSKLTRLSSSRFVQLLLVALIALLPSLYFYHQAMQAEQRAAAPAQNNLQTTAQVVKQVSRHILLPSGEQPTVATVSDASKVRSQAFFANAASGDKVLIYAQAKKAYLYRPGIDRIIEVAPLAPNKTAP